MGNNYNVPIQGSYSESTRTKLTPDVKFTSNELLQIINSQTSAKAIADKEAKDKATRLSKSESAYQKRIKTGIQSSQDLADETGAIGDKISLKNLPIVGKHIPEILDVTGMFGNMASGLGRIPLNVEKDDYGQVALSIATPLTVGALAGIGNPNTGQFINNIANPLAGTGDLINNLGSKYLPNAYKLNPNAFKPNPNNFYRQVDTPTFNEGLESGLIRGKQDIGYSDESAMKMFGDDAYYNKGRLYYKNEKDYPYLFEANLPEDRFIPKVNGRTRKYTTENTRVRVSKEPLPINDPNIKTYKKDWLQGYKQIEVPKTTQNFKSEIDNIQFNISKLKSEKELYEKNYQALVSKYKNKEITPEQYKIEYQKIAPENPYLIGDLEKQVRELKVKQDIFNTPQKNILTSETQLGKNISDGGSNNKGVFELGDNYVAKLSAHGYDDASRLVNYADKLTSPRIMKTHQVKEFNGKVYQVQDKAPGIPYTQLSEQQLKNLPKNHIDNFYKDIAELEKNGLNIDISGGKSNIFYDSKKGFQFIDLGIGKMPNINDINKVVTFKNGGALGNNGMFDMTNPNIYKTIVGGLASGTLGKQAMENKELGGYVRTSKSGRKFTYPSFEGQKQEIINRILTK